jgi:hypothetical protein
MPKSRSEFLYLCSIAFLLLLINYRILNTWFIVDDTACIFCSSFNTVNLLFDKGTYLFFNQLFFTPLLPILFKMDLLLFKMNPVGYHLHSLLVAFLSCVVFFKIVRMYCAPFFSWLGTLSLSVSLPMSFDIGWITRKHYLWGFLFSLIAIYLFKKWEGKKEHVLIALSLLATLLAFLCKEAYTALPAAVLVISSGSITDRVKKSFPYIVIFVIYLIWRIYMLGGIGGYPGSTGKSLSFLVWKLSIVPVDFLNNLFFPYFSLAFLLALILLALSRLNMMIVVTLLIFIVSAPFVFYEHGGFILAGKGLLLVAVTSFALTYTMHAYWVRKKWIILAISVIIFISALSGSFVRATAGHELIMKISSMYEKASKEILTHGDKKILVISEHCYYFSNLRDIYTILLKEKFPYMRATSTDKVIPFLNSQDFDMVIFGKNLTLKQPDISESSVFILKGPDAHDFIENSKKRFLSGKPLLAPEVIFTPSEDDVKVDITDTREGTYLRCIYMDSYIGCYPIPKHYTFKLNSVKEIEKIDIIYTSNTGEMSSPTTFRNIPVKR